MLTRPQSIGLAGLEGENGRALQSAPKLLERLSHGVNCLLITIHGTWLRLLRLEEAGKRRLI